MKNQGFSTFLPSWEYIPDGEPRIFGDRLYLFGSHDKFKGRKFCENDYVSWSCPLNDLSDWRFGGINYRAADDPDNRSGKNQLWAPDVTRGADGKYYLFYCLSNLDTKIGVAVSDTPDGRFMFYGHVKYKDGRALGSIGDVLPFDPALFIDDDGRVFIYYGNGHNKFLRDAKQNKASVVAELEPDMLTVKAAPKKLIPDEDNAKGTSFLGHAFFEASSMRKFGGKYYFIYSSSQSHELCYAISEKPDSGFLYQGVLISNGDVTEIDFKTGFNMKATHKVKCYMGNNHGSIVEIGGRYYIFYHRHTNRNMFSRQACAEPIEMLPDGRFKQAELTSGGLNGKPLCGHGVYEARSACHLYAKDGALFSAHPMVQNKKHPALTQDGADREDNPNQHIANMKDGATVGFRYFEFKNTRKIAVTTRGRGRGEFVVSNDADGKVVAKIPVVPSREWQTATSQLNIGDGTGSLYFTFCGKGAVDFLRFEMG